MGQLLADGAEQQTRESAQTPRADDNKVSLRRGLEQDLRRRSLGQLRLETGPRAAKASMRAMTEKTVVARRVMLTSTGRATRSGWRAASMT
jgi:hypothetical protein